MRRLIGVLCAVGAVALGVAPAHGAIEEEVTAEGGITVSWRGDPARGCAERAACDIHGSLTLDASASQGTTISSGDGDFTTLDVDFEAPTVRVLRGDPADPAGVCVDQLADTQLVLFGGGAGGNRLIPRLESAGDTVSAGRCTGPAAADFADLLPAVPVRGRIGGASTLRLDLRSRRMRPAGAFTVEVVSTLTAVVRRRVVRDDSFDGDALSDGEAREAQPVRRGRRAALLDVAYAVQRPSGALVTTFAGLPERGCVLLDACGVRGTTTLRLGAKDVDPLRIQAAVPAALARRGVGRTLRRLAAGGLRFASASAPEGLTGRLEAQVTRDGVPGACRDARDVEPPPLQIAQRGRRARIAVGGRAYASSGGLLRSQCPGPLLGAADGEAVGTVALSALARPRWSVALRPTAADTWPYAVATGGDARLTFRRLRARIVWVPVR